MSSVKLPFGRTHLTLELPQNATVLEAKATPALDNPALYIEQALAEPVGASSLRKIAKKKSSAVIVLSDFTRPVPHKLLLPPLLKNLESAGIPRRKITLLFACGLHRPMDEQEIIENLGQRIAEDYRVVNHRAEQREDLIHVGDIEGIPLWISRTLIDADLKILTGLIEPHLMAGFSGGCKLVAPGVAGAETIQALHSPKFLEDPRCREGVVAENPLQDTVRAIAQKVGTDFIINVALNEAREITGVFAGHPIKAHDTGIAFCRQCQEVECEEAEVVVTTSAGWPLDATFYQAVKGLTAALPALNSGGTLFLVAECCEGLGSPPFREELATIDDADEYLNRITRRSEVKADQWQLEELCRVLKKGRVIVYSPRLREDNTGRLFSFTDNLTEDIRGALARMGSDSRLNVIPQGPYVLLKRKGGITQNF